MIKLNRKIVLSSLSIVATLAIAGGAAYAQLTTTATAADITFTSENAALLIAKDPGGGTPPPSGNFASSQSFATPIRNVFPGFNQNYTFWLKNNSDTDIPLNNSVTVANVNHTSPDLNGKLNIGFNCTDMGTNGTTAGTPTANGTASLNAWETGPITNNVGTLQPQELALCTLNASIPTSVTSFSTPHESTNFDAVFTGTQVEPSVTPTSTPL